MKVKVKRVRGGSMGDQRNYGLVTGSIWNYEDKPTSNAVGDTIQESPRDKANIEAERGETVVGDIDSDGMLEHLKIGGKRHHSGGTPLNVPDGSFVFSDTSALRIKNKDLLKNIFGMNSSKSGVTPAQVARRYQLNDYKELLNDPWADPFEKRTAQMMMDNNLKKLGQLALIQESMKGFPDGIPNIALPLFASDMGEQQMMRKGGLVKYQGTQKSQVSNVYTDNMQKFNQWKRNWLDALKRNDVKRIQELKTEGAKLSTTLNEADVPWSLPINLSLFDPRTREISPGTQEGKLHDAADVIDNYLNFYEESGKSAQRLAENVRSKAKAEKTYLDLYGKAESIIKDYQTKGAASQYTSEDINNAYSTLDKLQNGIVKIRPGSGISDVLGLPYIDYNYNIRQDLPELEKLAGDYVFPAPAGRVTNQQKPTQTTSSSAPGVGVVTQENGVVNVDPTATQRSTSSAGQPTTTQKTRLTDAEIIALLKAQGQPDSVTTPEYILEWRRLNERDGGTINSRGLPKAQNGTETYDLLNRRVQEAAREKNQAITFPYSYYERGPSIGSQTKKRGYILSPEGILYKPGQKEPKIDELIKNVPIDWSTYQSPTTGKTGVNAWKEDIRIAQGAESHASDWYINKYNEYSVAKTGQPWFNINQPGVRIPGRQWSQPAIFADIPAEPQQPLAQPKTETKKPDDIQVKRQEYAPGLAMRPEIWNFDKVNMANAMLNRAMIERGADPTLYRYNPYLAEAVYMDPSYDIAAQQGALATAAQALGATAPTQQARANILQAQAQTAEPIAQITSQTNKANIALANQMAQQQAQAYNQAQLQNIQFQKRWEDEKEVLRQQYQNALAEGNTELAKSIMQAMKNAATTAWVNATQDQYAVDPATGSVYFKGGKDPFAFIGSEEATSSMIKEIQKISRDLGITVEEAAKLYRAGLTGKVSSKKSGVNPVTGAEARYGGKYKFGGEVFNPIDDIWN